MSEIQSSGMLVPFSYGDAAVRVVMIDGEPWFVLADLCKVLGLSNPSVVAQRIDEAALSQAEVSSGGQRRSVGVVNESGMYEVVIRSDKPEAVNFRRWITGTVLPQIRRTGSYNAAPALTGPELVAAALIEAHQMIEQRDARIYQLEAKQTADAPKVTYVDTYVTDADLLSFSTVASTNNIKECELRELLIRKDWIYRQEESRWSNKHGRKEIRYRYTEKADKKRYFRRVETHEAPRFRGEVMHTLKVTPAGAEAIARLIAREVAA